MLRAKRVNKKALLLLVALISMSVVFLFFDRLYSIKHYQPSNSGIVGKVLLGPLTPVVKDSETQANERPYPDARILLKDLEGRKTITQFTSDEKGEFRVNLPPGVYQLEPLTPKGQILPIGGPQVIEVRADEFTNVIVNYDTGIR